MRVERQGDSVSFNVLKTAPRHWLNPLVTPLVTQAMLRWARARSCRLAARAVFDEHALDALAGNVRQLVLVDEGHPGMLLLRRIREDAAERQGNGKERTEEEFHGASILRLADLGSGSCL